MGTLSLFRQALVEELGRQESSSVASVPPKAAASDPGQGYLPNVESILRVGNGQGCAETEEGVWYVCPRDGTRVKLPRTCAKARGCPRCSRAWAWREAGAVQARLDAIRLLWKFPAPRHVVFSYVEERESSEVEPRSSQRLQTFYDNARRVLLGAGYEGGWIVFHPDRHDGALCWRGGPHIHALVFGSKTVHLDGAVLKTVGARPDVKPTASYLLDHAGYVGRGQVGRYFGVAHWRESTVPVVARSEAVEAPACPVCLGPMVREQVVDGTAGAWRPAMVGWSS